MGLIDSKQYW